MTALLNERVKVEAGSHSFLMKPESHCYRLCGKGKVLAFRTYGRAICQRLAAAGLNAVVQGLNGPAAGGAFQMVIVAQKGES